jgi:YHS domain-containing protein
MRDLPIANPVQGVIDPVCGMTVDPSHAESRGLSAEDEGITYYFCGRGCLLDFRDDPKKYLDEHYVRTM